MSGSDSEHRSAFITETVNFNYNQLFCAEAWTELPPSFFELSTKARTLKMKNWNIKPRKPDYLKRGV